MKIQLAVLFGGKSVEHEISIISAIQAIKQLDRNKYDVYPIYVTKNQEFYTGAKIEDIEAYRDVDKLLKESNRVVLINDNGKVYMMDHPFTKRFKKTKVQLDVAFPIVHGTNVEDGTLQGYLKTLGIPFVGCDVTASAVGMDKYVMKTVLQDKGLPVLKCLTFHKTEYLSDSDGIVNAIEETFGEYPIIVKPVNLGSSVGISKAKDVYELSDALDLAFSFANKVLVEKAIVNLREINCSVIGDSDDATASECEEPLNASDILSYEDKYINGGGSSKSKTGTTTGSKSGSQGMASLARKIPADIPAEVRENIRELAVKTFKALDCNGVVRIDFMIDADTDDVYINEINTIPGSLSFYLWEALGIPYAKILEQLIQLALKRVRDEKSIVYSFDTNVLSGCTNESFGGSKTKQG